MEVLFIKFNFIDMLNQYLTNIYMLKNNLYNLHFNIKGEEASDIHKDITNDINIINDIYDRVSELIKKIGGYPIMNLDEIKNISSIKEIPSKDYSKNEALNILLNDLTLINNMNNQVGEYGLKNYDFETLNLVLFFNQYLQKRIWLLKMNKV